MSTPRHLRVAQSIKVEIASIILRDIKDPRMGGLVSVTDVECSNDCRRAKIFISVFEVDKQKGTMEVLEEQAGIIRGELCRRLKLRFAPDILFRLDTSLERGAQVSSLISKISRGEV